MASRASKSHPDANTGKPLEVEFHPRIEHAPHLHDGHACIKGTHVTVAAVLRLLERKKYPPPSSPASLNAADVSAALLYAAFVMETLPKLYAEIARLGALSKAREHK